jgi:hypothetical protein
MISNIIQFPLLFYMDVYYEGLQMDGRATITGRTAIQGIDTNVPFQAYGALLPSVLHVL